MNFYFQTRRPRRFHHEMIYSDERRDQLEQLERRARAELGMPPDSSDPACPRQHVSPVVSRFQFADERRQRRQRGWTRLLVIIGLLALLVILIIQALLLIL